MPISTVQACRHEGWENVAVLATSVAKGWSHALLLRVANSPEDRGNAVPS